MVATKFTPAKWYDPSTRFSAKDLLPTLDGSLQRLRVICSKARAALSACMVVIEPGWPELTLRRYLEKACAKLRVRTRIEAVVKAVRDGLIDP